MATNANISVSVYKRATGEMDKCLGILTNMYVDANIARIRNVSSSCNFTSDRRLSFFLKILTFARREATVTI